MQQALHNHTPDAAKPAADCVIIGVNSEKTLERCIRSILEGSSTADPIHICYADGGSTDRSIAIARQFPGVTVLELNPEHPTPGLGRNAGWKAGSAPYVQFLDSDTIMDPGWLALALKTMRENPELGAVRGYRREMHPERSFYNWLGDLEWNDRPGLCQSFGGDVLIRRKALEETGGYDETLVGGEDPELGWRISRGGWKILMLDALMTRHDLAMTTINQYLKRAYRSGYGFAAVQSRIAPTGDSFWKAEQRRITTKGGGFIAGIAGALLIPMLQHNLRGTILSLLSLAGGSFLLFKPRITKVGQFMRQQQLNRTDAKKYAWHCSLVVLPQLFGIIRFHAGQLLGKPLRNKRAALKTGLSTIQT
ncbi:glycosyltransferase [Chlorobium sp.]|jgi:GT2 family glycosyltransferase|uniref:glycosyltransferase n=1 Tax=Chlorobium sp. TaxID=1095 RepID=UPI0025C5F279|nr:glycosyltransferase [Chlorobium sp.]MCF8271897.1 glycosyltransferase [Chlorobium sp.]MCF8291878.1 glycosyltransferase [Chlorobium sp.]MCF8385986.1 glycosyltransferase [Chlorobium sp.]